MIAKQQSIPPCLHGWLAQLEPRIHKELEDSSKTNISNWCVLSVDHIAVTTHDSTQWCTASEVCERSHSSDSAGQFPSYGVAVTFTALVLSHCCWAVSTCCAGVNAPAMPSIVLQLFSQSDCSIFAVWLCKSSDLVLTDFWKEGHEQLQSGVSPLLMESGITILLLWRCQPSCDGPLVAQCHLPFCFTSTYIICSVYCWVLYPWLLLHTAQDLPTRWWGEGGGFVSRCLGLDCVK